MRRSAIVNKEHTKIIPTEQQECTALFQFAQTVPLLKEYLIHHANEGKRTIYYGKTLKDMGLRPGFPDYQLPLPNGEYIGLFIEMKRVDPKLHKRQIQQDEWLAKLSRAGHYAVYTYGWEDAKDVCMEYIKTVIVDFR